MQALMKALPPADIGKAFDADIRNELQEKKTICLS